MDSIQICRSGKKIRVFKTELKYRYTVYCTNKYIRYTFSGIIDNYIGNLCKISEISYFVIQPVTTIAPRSAI